jgi:hypothetical protein
MNLLAMLDLSRDVVGGEWREVPGGITSDDSKYARLALPYQPPAEYDFKVEFTRTGRIEESVVQLFVLHGHGCAWVMNGWQGALCAFSMINGRVGKDNGTATRDVPLHAGERHISVVKVRKDAIEAYLDGKLLNRHPTNGSDLSLVRDWDLRGRPLGIGSFQNAVVFHAIEILEITGKGRLLVDSAGPVAPPTVQQDDQDDPVR